MTHKPEEIQEDVKRVMESLGVETITRDKYLTNGARYSKTSVVNHFGGWSALLESLGVATKSGAKKVFKSIEKQSKADVYRTFQEDEVKPWTVKYAYKGKRNRLVTIIVISDIHDIDHDPFTMRVFFEAIKMIQPDFIVLNGDGYDCPEFSRYNQDPRTWDVAGRFNWMKQEFWTKVRESCPDSELWFIVGNHEMRVLKHLAEKDVSIMSLLGDFLKMSFKDLFGIEEFGVNFVCKNDLAAWSKTDHKHEMKKNFYVFLDSWIAAHECDFGFGMSGSSGHTHRSQYTPKRSFNGPYNWMVTPGAVIQDANYVERITAAECGFGIVHIDTYHNKANQKLVLTTDGFCEVGGRYFFREKDE